MASLLSVYNEARNRTNSTTKPCYTETELSSGLTDHLAPLLTLPLPPLLPPPPKKKSSVMAFNTYNNILLITFFSTYSTYLIKAWNCSKRVFVRSAFLKLAWHLQFLAIASFLVIETPLTPQRQGSDLLS